MYEDPISREVLNHSNQAVDKHSKVVARKDILDKVKAYITGNSNSPLVVHGSSGCGKSSVLASAAVEVSEAQTQLTI